MATRVVPAFLGLCIVLFGQAPPARGTAYTSTLLERLRKATLTRSLSSIASIHTSGRIEVVGLNGTSQEWDDLRGRRFTATQEAGALSGGNGWDGKVAWSQDYAGLVTIDGGAAGRLQAIDQAYLDNFGYLRPDAGGATVIYAGQRGDAGRTYDVLAVTPPQGSEVDIWIDPGTHLIARETGTIGLVSQTTVLSNYHRVDGINYPFTNTSQTSTGNSSTIKVSSLEVNKDVAEHVRVPRSSPRDFTITGGSSTTVPIQIVNNHIYLDVSLNGRGPYRFVLDTGGDYIVTPEIVAALQAKSAGGLQLSGVGSTTEGASFTYVDSIAVGNALVRDQYMLVLPIATGFGVAEGFRIDGMIGYQLLARFVTKIDYANSRLAIAMPASAPASAPGAAAIPFFFDSTIPRIPISIGNVTTTAEVDTGSRGGLTMSSPFVANHPAVAALAKTAATVEGFGVGGPSYAGLGRVPSARIGPYLISNSVAAFGIQTQGAMADPFNPVNLGGTILRRFDVTLDYQHQLILLAKNALFDAPFSYDRSGLFLIDQNGAYTILSVTPGSPAAADGLLKGDTILAVNGAPASNAQLAALRTLLAGPAGTVVHMRIRGPRGVERDLSLTLADYV
jgi:hypothetical protein